jgi:protein SCO1/2
MGLAILMIPRGSATPVALAGGDVLPARMVAPNFHLRDQFGHVVSLSEFRGRPVLITFVQSHCTGLCPVITDTIRRVLTELGPAGNQIGVVAISVDPEHDTAASARAYSRQHGMLTRWHYMLGSRKALAPLWRRYFVAGESKNAPAGQQAGHTAATYLVDARGHERVLFVADPRATDLARDIQILDGLVVTPLGDQALPAPQVGHPAPQFSLATLSGTDVNLHRLRGKTVLINFWATWCTACKSEMPALQRFSAHFEKRGGVVVGVDKQESASDVGLFDMRVHVTYPLALDASGNVSDQYDVSVLPTSVLVDRYGTVRWIKEGILSPSDFSHLLSIS